MKKIRDNFNKTMIFFFILSSSLLLQAQENSPKKEEKENLSANHENHTHDEREDHESKEGENHDEEAENPSIGKEKGILAKGSEGFQLSPEAIKSFELRMQEINNSKQLLPLLALVKVQENQFIFRVREGWIKKIPVKIISKNKETIVVDLVSFKPGDKVVVKGASFLRVTELTSEEGPQGHSH